MCVLPFLIPIHARPYTAFYNEWLAIALGLAAALPLLAPRWWRALPLPRVALVPLGLATLIVLQGVLGLATDWQTPFIAVLYLLWACLMMVVGAGLAHTVGLGRLSGMIAGAMLVAALLTGALALLQWADVRLPWLVARDVAGYGGNLAQVNHQAEVLGVGLVAWAYFMLGGRLPLALAWAMVLPLLVALALTGARMGVLYVVLLALAGAVWAWRQPGQTVRRRGLALLVLIPLFYAVQLGLPHMSGVLTGAMPFEKVVEGFNGPSVRWQLIQEAWRVFMAHPLLGVGWGGFVWQDFLLAPVLPAQPGMASHAHNLIMQLLAETGSIGALWVAGGLLAWLVAQHRVPLDAARAWLLAALAVPMIHSLLEYPLWYGYFLGVVALLLGAGETRLKWVAFAPGPLVAGATLAFGAFALAQALSQYGELRAVMAALSQNVTVEHRQADLERLAALSRKVFVGPAADVLLVRALPKDAALAQDVVLLSTRAVRRFPSEALTYDHAAWLALAGRRDEALSVLRCALARYPGRADAFAVELMRSGAPAFVPLLLEVARFNRKRLGLPPLPQRPHPASAPRLERTHRENFPNDFGKVALAQPADFS